MAITGEEASAKPERAQLSGRAGYLTCLLIAGFMSAVCISNVRIFFAADSGTITRSFHTNSPKRGSLRVFVRGESGPEHELATFEPWGYTLEPREKVRKYPGSFWATRESAQPSTLRLLLGWVSPISWILFFPLVLIPLLAAHSFGQVVVLAPAILIRDWLESVRNGGDKPGPS